MGCSDEVNFFTKETRIAVLDPVKVDAQTLSQVELARCNRKNELGWLLHSEIPVTARVLGNRPLSAVFAH